MNEFPNNLLTVVCESIYNSWKLSPQIEQENKSLLYDLQKHIQQGLPDTRLELYGSSCNGFGFINSDLDICFTLETRCSEKINQEYVIERLMFELKKYQGIRDIFPIITAKVPIIKFSFKDIKKDVDISMFNTLAQYNTKLLSTYCKIDSRVQKLGYVLKYFVKTCNICDAARGSLSSYAYILMLLYYLQQTNPPVIPVLQELYDRSEPMPFRDVEGWNTWFYEDISNLPNIWTNYNKNKMSLAELWIGFLKFYSKQFRKTEFVVSIRQTSQLTRSEKLWNRKNSIAIEDPFNLNHNLGSGVPRKMNVYIFSVFQRGYEHFRRPILFKRNLKDLLEYFFNKRILTGNMTPPNRKFCNICHKRGHEKENCFRKQFFNVKYKRGSKDSGDSFR